MKRALRNNGLSIALLAVFVLTLGGQSVAGWLHSNDERRDHAQPILGYGEYLVSSHFFEALMENWESEFFQMAAYVFFTAFLFQRGSAESKDPDKPEEVDKDPRTARLSVDAPWPVRRGGWVLRIYENSLGLAFVLLFLASLFFHAAAGAREHNRDLAAQGDSGTLTTLEYFGTSRFWFESLQNWQSEYLSIALMVILSIWLRQRGSPESKPVAAPHSQTGC